MAVRVLLIDDDTELCGLLDQFLRREGFEVTAAHDGPSGLDAARAGTADIVVLDIGLPKLDGFGVLRKLRETSRIPVLMLTARGEDIDRIVGLELGADDYLPKPFNPRELSARLRAILRRMEPREETRSERLEVNGVRLDPSSREVTLDGQKVELTTVEFDILQTMMQAAGRVLSRDVIMEALYQRKASPFDRAIDVHISHLRKKLETGRVLIRTVRGVGYQFCRNAQEAGE
ncbi:MAG: response regulator transcription factor [Bryobacterales bacterium]|nr:response regulator transcription factor [Bryobacterales bacterium]